MIECCRRPATEVNGRSVRPVLWAVLGQGHSLHYWAACVQCGFRILRSVMPIFSIMSIASDMTRLSILKSPPGAQRARVGAAAQHAQPTGRTRRDAAARVE